MLRWEVDRNGSGSCSMVGSDSDSAELLEFTARKLVKYIGW
jgi:hypothetical protein